MKILLIMDPGIPVPPKGYGGHERLVYMFAREYAKQGHEVDLLVSPGSSVEGCTVYTFGKEGFPPKKWDARRAVIEAWAFLWRNRMKYDFIHNFGRLIYLIPVLNHPVKKVMTYGREISTGNIKAINRLPNKNLIFTGCSADLISRGGVAGNWKVVYNAIPFEKYTLQENVKDDAPYIFLGRLERIKGCHTAIEVVKQLGAKLIIAGNISPLPEEQEYFNTKIKPFIDGEQIVYVGQVNDQEKNLYLGLSKALLFPIEWNEPFGMVMAEAMACGTPIVGFRRGSVPEVVEHGVTGYLVENTSEMIDVLHKVDSLNRQQCRDAAMSRFDVSIVSESYLSIL